MNPTLLGFIKKELTQTLRDPKMRFVLFVFPLIQLIIYGYGITSEVRNIRLAAFHDSKDYVTRDIYDRAIEGKWFLPAKTTEQDPFRVIQSGQADAVIVAPPGGFTRGLGQGTARLQLLINSVNVLQAQSVESYLKNIVLQTVQDDLKTKAQERPIQFDTRVLFNPDLETSWFMVPGTICTLMVIATLVMTNNAMVREKEMGTFETLIAAPVSGREILLGKSVPYVILGLAQFPLILLVATTILDVPQRGSYLALVGATLAFVLSTVSFGILISTFCRNQQQASLAAFLFLFPAVMFSGLMFPIENMPDYLQWLSYIDPLSHYLGLLRNIMLKGGEQSYVLTRTGYLLLLAIGSILLAASRFKTKLS